MAGETTDRVRGPSVLAGLLMLRPEELLRISVAYHVDPEAYLDIQAEIIGKPFDTALFSQIRARLPDVLRTHSRLVPYPMDLHRTATALMLRLEAEAAIDPQGWMQEIWQKAISDSRILVRIGHYFSSAALAVDPESGALVFDENAARRSLMGA